MLDFLTHEMLAMIWFFLWCVIWGVYFMVDSFSLGAGLLIPFLPKDRSQRIQMQKAVGPFWGGNEVWLILAAGGTFAAFPLVFSKMFTFLYLPMMLLLIGLILRGICVEYLHKDESSSLQNVLKWGWFVGSLLISLVLGVAFANFFKGLAIATDGSYQGTLLSLFTPYALIGGILFVLISVTSGAFWLQFKTKGVLVDNARELTNKTTLIVLLLTLVYLLYSFVSIPGFTTNYTNNPLFYVFPLLAVIAAFMSVIYARKKKAFMGFITTILTILGIVETGLASIYPYMLKSAIVPAAGIDIFEAASSHLTLSVMLIGALVFVPIVIIYQLWAYTLFKEKIEETETVTY